MVLYNYVVQSGIQFHTPFPLNTLIVTISLPVNKLFGLSFSSPLLREPE